MIFGLWLSRLGLERDWIEVQGFQAQTDMCAFRGMFLLVFCFVFLRVCSVAFLCILIHSSSLFSVSSNQERERERKEEGMGGWPGKAYGVWNGKEGVDGQLGHLPGRSDSLPSGITLYKIQTGRADHDTFLFLFFLLCSFPNNSDR